jgi:tRNA G46 methylase TrmB
MTREFLAEVARVLRQNGSLRLMTDDADYFAEMRGLSAGGWREIPWDDGIERPTTTFEKTFRALGTLPFQLALEHVLPPGNQPQIHTVPPNFG